MITTLIVIMYNTINSYNDNYDNVYYNHKYSYD